MIFSRPSNTANPKARGARLVVRELDEEALVYDLDTHRATCLNPFSAKVWRECDGTHTIGDIARSMGLDVADEPVILLTIDKLAAATLLQPSLERQAAAHQLPNRRELLQRVALLAAVATITVPTPAMAGSVPFNGPCSSDSNCVPGLVCRGGKYKND